MIGEALASSAQRESTLTKLELRNDEKGRLLQSAPSFEVANSLDREIDELNLECGCAALLRLERDDVGRQRVRAGGGVFAGDDQFDRAGAAAEEGDGAEVAFGIRG